MPVNNQKVISIIIEEIKKLDERCSGYHELLTETVTDILAAEGTHRISLTNIQQQITEKCKAAGGALQRQTNSDSQS